MGDREAKRLNKLKRRLWRTLRYVLAACGALLLLFAALLAALPPLLSSDFAKAKVVAVLSDSLKRPSGIDTLSFGWSEGLRLSGLRIGEGDVDTPGFLLRLEELRVEPGLAALLRGDLRLTVALRGLRLRAAPEELASTPAPEPPAKPLHEALRALFEGLQHGLEPRPLGLDAHLALSLDDANILFVPKAPAKPVALSSTRLSLALPGLAEPLRLEAASDVLLPNGEQVPFRLAAGLAGIKDAAGRVDPAAVDMQLKLSAPGMDLTGGGSLAKGLALALRLDFRPALRLASAFAPALPEADGRLALDLSAQRADAEHVEAALTSELDLVRLSGGPLGEMSLGPLRLRLGQEARLDLRARTAQLPGSMDVQQHGQLRWTAGLSGVAEGKPVADFRLTRLEIPLAEVIHPLRAYLPPGLDIGGGSLAARDLTATLRLDAPDAEPGLRAQIQGLTLALSDISRRDKESRLAVGRLEAGVHELSAELPGAHPGQAPGSVHASLDVAVSGLRHEAKKDGKTTITRLASLLLPLVDLRLDGFRQDKAALFGVSGKLKLEEQAQLADLDAGGKVAIRTLAQSLRLSAELPAEQRLAASLEEFKLEAPVIRAMQAGKKPLEVPLLVTASARSLTLSGPAPLTPGADGLRVNVQAGQAADVDATADLRGAGGRDIASQGRARLDLEKLLALAAPLLPAKAKGAGGIAAEWKIAANLPAPTTDKQPAAPKKLSQTIRELSFLRELSASLDLRGLSLDWPLAPGADGRQELLHVKGISTPKPLTIATREGLRESSLSGSVAFGPMDSLPGAGKLAKPLRGLFTINARQQGARSAQISEVLHLDGFELDQNLSLTLDKLDALLDREDRATAALEALDATADFSLNTGLHALPATAKAAQGLSGKGRLAASGSLRLAGGRSLAVSARVDSPGVDLNLGQDMAISGLTSNLRFSRRYAIAPALLCPGDAEQSFLPLSEQVFGLPGSGRSSRESLAADALGQLLRTDAANPAAAVGGFGFAQLKMKSGGLPITLRDVDLRLDASSPVPGLRSFRAGLLGGDVLGSAVVRKNEAGYVLSADLAFTGIDPGHLLPAKAPRDLGSQAETSGRVSLEVPLTPDPERLLQRLKLRLDISKVGPRTLERMLYALDPEEQNETIVQQRRLMGIGYPRWLRVGAFFGNLSLSGAVEVKGFQLDLPQVDRLSLANLPVKQKLQKPLQSMPALIRALDAASGSVICRDAAAPHSLRVVQPAAEQGAPQ